MPNQTSDYKEYESAVRKALEDFAKENFPGVEMTVRGSYVYEGKSGRHQVDVSMEGFLRAGVRVFLIAECKCYKRKASKRDVTSFCSIKNDLEPDFAFMFTTKDFDKGAREFASGNNITLIVQPEHSLLSGWKIVIPAAAITAVLLKQAAKNIQLESLQDACENDKNPDQESDEDIPDSGLASADSAQKGDIARVISAAMVGSARYKDDHGAGNESISKVDIRDSREVAGDDRPSNREIAVLCQEISSDDRACRQNAVDSLGLILSQILGSILLETERKRSTTLSRLARNKNRSRIESDHKLAQLISICSDISTALCFAMSHTDIETRIHTIQIAGRTLTGCTQLFSLHDRGYSAFYIRSEIRSLTQCLRPLFMGVIEALTASVPPVEEAAANVIVSSYPNLLEAESFWSELSMSSISIRRLSSSILPDYVKPALMTRLELCLPSANPTTHAAAIFIWCGLIDARVADLFAPILADETKTHQLFMIRALGRLHNEHVSLRPGSLDALGIALGKCLSSSDFAVKREAARVLKNGRFPSSRQALGHALNDTDDSVRERAALGLVRLGDARGVPILIAIVDDPKKLLDSEPVAALAEFRCRPAIPALAQKARMAKYSFERERYLDAIRSIDEVAAGKIAKELPRLSDVTLSPTADPAQTGVLPGIAVAGMIGAFHQGRKMAVSRRDFLLPWRWFSPKE